jgi:Alw26I/Eco31I/Esp3I family type II restriction m6 adenine DNA methyltransferase
VRQEGERVRSGGGGMPSAAEEARLYPLVDQLQRHVATLASAATDDLRDVPTWTIQMLLFELARRVGARTGFLDFSRLESDGGSRVFRDDAFWVGDEEVPGELAGLVAAVSDASLRVLIGRSLDYGRTTRWESDGRSFFKARDLAAAKTQGIFYTPAFVARYLAERGLRGWSAKHAPLVCDPAIGGGIFLLAAAEQLLKRFDPTHVAGHLYGADTDPVAAEVAAILVDSALGRWSPGTPPPSLGTTIIVGDSFGGPVRPGNVAGLPGAIDWTAVFPEVFSERDGFDLVLVNPPFGRYKVDSDWLIAKEMRLDPQSLKMMRISGQQRAATLRGSGWYPLSTVGVIDKSRLGLERAMQLTAPAGRVGAILPTTLTADVHSTKLRRALLEDWSLEEASEFPEAARLFYDVSQSTSAVVARRQGRTKWVSVRSDVRSEKDLRAPFQGTWSISLIKALSPKCPIPVRAGGLAAILEVLHRHERLGALPQLVNARGEVDLTVFSSVITDDPKQTPLVRGDQVDCYRTDLASDKKRFVDSTTFETRLRSSVKLRHAQSVRLVGRQCSYLYRPKRLSFAVVPAGQAVANSCNYLTGVDEDTLFYILAFLNSEVLNWRFGITNSNNHVANSELAELPVPRLSPASREFAWIAGAARELSHAFEAELDAELDARVAHAYGLDSKQAELIHAARARKAVTA